MSMLNATRSYIEGLLNGLALDTGVRFKEAEDFVTNVKTKTIGYNMNKLKQMPFLSAKGVMLHELGHVLYTNDVSQTQTQKDHPQIQEVYNAFEDVRIEQKLNRKYGDFSSQSLASILNTAIGQFQDKIKENGIDSIDELNKLLMFAGCFSLSEIHSVSINTNSNFYKAYSGLNSSQLALIRDLYTAMLEAKNLNSVSELKNFIDEKIFPKIKHLLTDKTPPQKHASKVEGFGRGECEPKNTTIDTLPSHEELIGVLNPYINTLSNKLKNILTENKAVKYTGNHLQGRLLSKNAYKVLTDERRIFSRRNKPNIRDYDFKIILDNSGSMMDGNKHQNTFIGAFLVYETCKRLGFKTELIKYDNQVKIIDSMEGYRPSPSGSNQDELVLRETIARIDNNNNTVVIMLTDGGVCSDPTIPIQELKKLGVPFFPVGVGLSGHDKATFNEYYPNPIYPPTVEDIPKTLIGIMNKVIHR